ncbi:MAG: hypothetical protein OEV90_03795 [Gammaproteobacteria bacterium]|nr:hypothetical protein [Gammaproteobacteria bacterium]
MTEFDPAAEQRRRIRRTAIVLAVVAIAIYVAFIASGVMNAQP